MYSAMPGVWLCGAGPGQLSEGTQPPGIETLKYPTEGTPGLQIPSKAPDATDRARPL